MLHILRALKQYLAQDLCIKSKNKTCYYVNDFFFVKGVDDGPDLHEVSTVASRLSRDITGVAPVRSSDVPPGIVSHYENLPMQYTKNALRIKK